MKLLRNITLGASMLLANQACTSVNQAHKTENSTSLTFEQKIESGSKTEQLLKTLRGMGLSINNIQGLQIGSDSSSESFVFTSSNHSKFDQDFLNTAYKKLGYLIFKINFFPMLIFISNHFFQSKWPNMFFIIVSYL